MGDAINNLNNGANLADSNTVPAPSTNNIYYILVEKTGKGFNIIEKQSDNKNITYGNTAQNISSEENIIFPVLVTKTKSNNNSFTVGTGDSEVSYTLDLEAETSNENTKQQIDANTFKTINIISGGSSTAREQSSLENITVNNGGQKQKQQKSKRNYSKKRRSSKSKSDTLRNYFNYDHLQ